MKTKAQHTKTKNKQTKKQHNLPKAVLSGKFTATNAYFYLV